MRITPLATVCALQALCFSAMAEHAQLEPVVVVAPLTNSVLTVTTDTKAPRQPIPAQDGADLLKNIPGFAVTRKGGTDGDPLFRGMAASRLNILLDGETILGGCGNRMDPPTAYVFPEAFDTVTLIKGPQSVKHGGGNSAGVVMFERATPDFSHDSVQGYVSILQGSFGRNDQMAQIQSGGKYGYVSMNGTRTDSNNYRDGDGNEVHSAYTRLNANAAIGLTLSPNSRIEINAAKSDGEARYADRAMDGSKFDRTNMGFLIEQFNLSPTVTHAKVRAYRNYIDHVMDNYRLREQNGMQMVSNPDRETTGANITAQLLLDDWTIDLGMDHQQNSHTVRGTLNYANMPRIEDMNFENSGVFIEGKRLRINGDSVHLGFRINNDAAEDLRANKTTSNSTTDYWLTNGFMRYEQRWGNNTRTYAGIGHSERAPDYWERTRNPNATSGMMTGNASTFDIKPERTTQVDIGAIYQAYNLNASISAFAAKHNDYILIESLTNVASTARNITAQTYGAEADILWNITSTWSTLITAAWVQGENTTNKRPLGQMPAPEMRIGVNYNNGRLSAGVLWRLVDQQHRVAPKEGNIVGQDIGKSEGFDILSINAGYRMQQLLLTAGIDNILNVNYAEHISRSDATIPGYETTERVQEPGRNIWFKAQLTF